MFQATSLIAPLAAGMKMCDIEPFQYRQPSRLNGSAHLVGQYSQIPPTHASRLVLAATDGI